MKNIIKNFIAWLRCENEKYKEIQGNGIRCGIPFDKAFKYSELIKMFPMHGQLGDDDIIQISHKREDSGYETCYVTIKQLKDAIIGGV